MSSKDFSSKDFQGLKRLLRRSCLGGDWIRGGVTLWCNTYTHIYHPIHKRDNKKIMRPWIVVQAP